VRACCRPVNRRACCTDRVRRNTVLIDNGLFKEAPGVKCFL
jgi:hypothetical protein